MRKGQGEGGWEEKGSRRRPRNEANTPPLSPSPTAELWLHHFPWVWRETALALRFWPHTTTPPPCSGASEGSVQQPPLELRPGEYRVLLCVDVGEAKG